MSQVFTLGDSFLNGEQVQQAQAVSGQSGTWQVNIDLTNEGSEALANATGELMAKQSPQNEIAIVVDGRVSQALPIEQKVIGGQIQLSGLLSRSDAEALIATITSSQRPYSTQAPSDSSLAAASAACTRAAALFKPGLEVIVATNESAADALSKGGWTVNADVLRSLPPETEISYCTASASAASAPSQPSNRQLSRCPQGVSLVPRVWQVAVDARGAYAAGSLENSSPSDSCTILYD